MGGTRRTDENQNRPTSNPAWAGATSGTWDAGLGVLRTVTDPNLSVTSVGYDGFGRVTFVRPPPVAGCTSSTVPVQRFVYELTTNPASSPVSIVTAYQEHDCTLIGADTIVTRSYVDGLGRARATLSTAEESGSWIQSGISILNARGTVRRTFQAERVSLGVAPTASQALIFPATPYEESAYDAFDRPIARWAPDGGLYTTTYHALTRDECDPLDHGSGTVSHFTGTCTTIRLDGHGRVTDQVLRNRLPGATAFEYYRLFTFYRADGAVTRIERTETTSDTTYNAIVRVPGHSVTRTFTYDTAGRRIGTTDPDSDRISGGTVRDRTWRYLFNRVGDLAAVRDSRGCGQNFYYDDAARLIAEDYIACSDSAAIRENSGITLPANAILMGRVTTTVANLEVHYYFDAAPSWATAVPEVAGSEYLGRLAGVSDRGQRSVMAYDDRGQVTFSVRQMRVIPAFTPTIGVATDGRPVVSGTMPTVTRVYDTAHSYSRRATYDHGGRPTNMILPLDPDYGGGGAAPLIGGRLSYNRRGLPELIELLRDDTPGAPGVVMTDPAIQEVISELIYSRDGLVDSVTYGDARDDTGAARTPTVSTMTYDVRRRPITMETVRTPTGTGTMLDPRPLSAVTIPFSQLLTWDPADNLTAITDLRDGAEWPDGYRPQHTTVEHDALYRVTRADYAYTVDALPYADTDAPSNWRTEALLSRPNDPMGSRPAPMIDELPSSRPMHMTWEYDWLGNAEMWNDDANQFYERSIGDITNGADLTGTVDRPGAIRIAHNLVPAAVGADHGGWLEVEYGLDGNVSLMTVHANCRDDNDDSNGDAGLEVCQPHPTPTASYGSRVSYLRDRCICAQEQHYNYRWDELNRIAEAMRFDRTGGSGTWTPMVRQRYLYDSANERTVKQTLDLDVMSSTPEAVALYVYPGDFERRGLVRNAGGTSYTALPGAETQYVVGGARLVWRTPTRNPAIGIDRDQRLTIGLSDLIQSTSATLDLLTGELVETSNYYANGARESYRASTNGDRVAPEPMGFTGKEADEEVGLTYFGQRYLMSHLGRWASPDPLQTHAVGGGEALNGYHYVSGNVLQVRDPLGLDGDESVDDVMARVLATSLMTEGFEDLDAGMRTTVNRAYSRGSGTADDLIAAASFTPETGAIRVSGPADSQRDFLTVLRTAMVQDPGFRDTVMGQEHFPDASPVRFRLVGGDEGLFVDNADAFADLRRRFGDHRVDMDDLMGLLSSSSPDIGEATTREELLVHFFSEAVDETSRGARRLPSGTEEADALAMFREHHRVGTASENAFRLAIGQELQVVGHGREVRVDADLNFTWDAVTRFTDGSSYRVPGTPGGGLDAAAAAPREE